MMPTIESLSDNPYEYGTAEYWMTEYYAAEIRRINYDYDIRKKQLEVLVNVDKRSKLITYLGITAFVMLFSFFLGIVVRCLL